MKKVKLFLTVSTFCLAIAAVATTKANSRFNETGYTLAPNGTCTKPSNIICSSVVAFGCVDGAGNQLFRFNQNGGCIQPLAKP